MPLITADFQGVGQNVGGHQGIYKRSDNGRLYVVLNLISDPRYIRPIYSGNDGVSWTNDRTPKTFGSGTGYNVESLFVLRDASSDVLHIAVHVNNGTVYYVTYNMVTDGWGTQETVHTNAGGSADGYGVVLRQHPTTGNIWILFQGDRENVSGTDYNRIYLTERTAANTYSTPLTIDSGSALNVRLGDFVFDGNDLIHLFYSTSTPRVYRRTYNGTTLSSAVEVSDSATASANNPAKRLGYYNTRGVERVTFGWRGPSGYPHASYADDAGTPAAETAVDSSAVATWDANNSGAITIVSDDDANIVHMLFVRSSDGDVYLSSSVEGGPWSSPAVVVSGITANWVDASIYTNSSSEVCIGILHCNAGSGGTTFTEYVLYNSGQYPVAIPLDSGVTTASGVPLTVTTGSGDATVNLTSGAVTASGVPLTVDNGSAISALVTSRNVYGDNGGGRWGPFQLANGNLIVFSVASLNQIHVSISTDGGANWSDGTSTTYADQVFALWAEVDAAGDVLHVAAHISGGVVLYRTYTASTDTWSAVETVHTNAHGNSDGFGVVLRQHPLTGNIWIFYQGDTESVYSVERLRSYFTERTGASTYSSPVSIDGDGVNHYITVGDMIIDSAGLIHFFYGTWQPRVYHRSYNGSALSAVEEVSDTAAPFASNVAKRMAFYVSGITRVGFVWRGPSSYPYSSYMDNDGTPAAEAAIGNLAVEVWDTDNAAALAIVADPGLETFYAVFADDTTSDIYIASKVGDADWSAPSELIDGITARWLNASVYINSSSELVLGLIYDQSGVGVTYYEYVIRTVAGAPVSIDLASGAITATGVAASVSDVAAGSNVIVNLASGGLSASGVPLVVGGGDVSVNLASGAVTASGVRVQPRLASLTYRWSFMVDWQNNGTYTDEGSRLRGCSIRRGRQEELNPSGGGQKNFNAATVLLTLDNSDRRFDGFNTSSPLYPYVLPARRCYLEVRYGNWTERVFTGLIYDIIPMGREDRVQIPLIEPQEIYQRNVPLGVYTNRTVSYLVGLLTSTAGAEAVDVPQTLNSLRYWWPTGETYMACLQHIAEAFQDDVFIDRFGQVLYIDHTQSGGASWSISEEAIGKTFEVKQPWLNLRNQASVKSRARNLDVLSVLWTLPDVPSLVQGQTFETTAIFSDSTGTVPAIDVISPVSGIDFVANLAPDGSSTDMTGQFTVTASIYGTQATILIEYTGTGDPAYITNLQIRGRPLSASNVHEVIRRDNTSIAAFRSQQITIDNPLIQSYATAFTLADQLIARYKDPKLYMVIRQESRGEQRQFAADLGRRITVDIPSIDINDHDMKLAEISHEWRDDNGQAIVTTWRLEPWPDYSGYWHFPTVLGVTSRLGA